MNHRVVVSLASLSRRSLVTSAGALAATLGLGAQLTRAA
jgi:hypothetical protein